MTLRTKEHKEAYDKMPKAWEEKPYPPGHNWEGLTPSQVNEAYAQSDKNQDEEIIEELDLEIEEKLSPLLSSGKSL